MKKKVQSVCVFPSQAENKYIPIVIDTIKEAGYEFIPFENCIKKIGSVDAFVLNWFDTLPARRTWYCFLRRVIFVLGMKILGKEINCTVHNKQPHEGKTWFSIKMTQLLLTISAHIFILCDDTRDVIGRYINYEKVKHKIVKLPLPSYSGAYGDPKSVSRSSDNGKMRLLYFGLIKPYKNTELLIDSVLELSDSCDIDLLVCGKCADENFAGILKNKVGNSNSVRLDLRFIDDDEVVEMLKDFDALVLPYSMKSTLNSSAAVLAFSYKRTVISSLNGTLRDLPYQEISYAYEIDESDTDHKRKLKETIERAYEDFKYDPNILINKGLKAYEVINRYNSPEVLKDVFRSIW